MGNKIQGGNYPPPSIGYPASTYMVLAVLCTIVTVMNCCENLFATRKISHLRYFSFRLYCVLFHFLVCFSYICAVSAGGCQLGYWIPILTGQAIAPLKFSKTTLLFSQKKSYALPPLTFKISCFVSPLKKRRKIHLPSTSF